MTVVPSYATGYLTVYPTSDSSVPVSSDVNWAANEARAVPNFTVADTAGTGNVEVYDSHGATINLLIDVFGYFTRQLPTSTVVSQSANTVTYGHESAIELNVAVATRYGEAVPNGESVVVHIGSVTCTAGLKAGKGYCSLANTALPAGSYTAWAGYGGDEDLASSSVTASNKLTVYKDDTGTSVSESPTTVVYGQESASVFSVTAKTNHYGEAVPDCETTVVHVGSVACTAELKGGKGACTISNTELAVGSDGVSVNYGGDASLNSSSATSVAKLTVSKDSTSIAVSESPTSVAYGQESSVVFSVVGRGPLRRDGAQRRGRNGPSRLGVLHRVTRGSKGHLFDCQHCAWDRLICRVRQLRRVTPTSTRSSGPSASRLTVEENSHSPVGRRTRSPVALFHLKGGKGLLAVSGNYVPRVIFRVN